MTNSRRLSIAALALLLLLALALALPFLVPLNSYIPRIEQEAQGVLK